MTSSRPTLGGSFFKDHEDEIRRACGYLEEIGLRYKLIDNFIIHFSSNDLVIVISLERYYGTLSFDYYLPRGNGSPPNLERDQRYSLIWTLVLYKKGRYKEKYLPEGLSTIQQIEACVKFFKDFEDVLLDRDFAEDMRAEYDVIAI